MATDPGHGRVLPMANGKTKSNKPSVDIEAAVQVFNIANSIVVWCGDTASRIKELDLYGGMVFEVRRAGALAFTWWIYHNVCLQQSHKTQDEITAPLPSGLGVPWLLSSSAKLVFFLSIGDFDCCKRPQRRHRHWRWPERKNANISIKLNKIRRITAGRHRKGNPQPPTPNPTPQPRPRPRPVKTNCRRKVKRTNINGVS